ncbi:MAG TPA: LytTR family DNA-binding domain-containing protein [Verrucomicrobiota bacterium]|nr:LytTR family DNA-binding domain-containing protein [Verrucomicrobiota bacterium]
MKLRTLIVDDDAVARELLALWLKDDPEVEVVGSCGTGEQAVRSVEEDSPDLVFLDIQMPGLNGFDVLAKLDPARRPVVVFVTGNDSYAVRAFEVHALDYLLKPFDRQRFVESLARAKKHIGRSKSDNIQEQLNMLLRELRPGSKPSDRIAVKSAGRVLLLKTSDIQWAEAADNYVQLHVGNETHSLRQTLTEFESRLSPEKFVRVSRSAIVNVDFIKELQPMFHGEYVIRLKTGQQVTLTRGYRSRLETAGLL